MKTQGLPFKKVTLKGYLGRDLAAREYNGDGSCSLVVLSLFFLVVFLEKYGVSKLDANG